MESKLMHPIHKITNPCLSVLRLQEGVLEFKVMKNLFHQFVPDANFCHSREQQANRTLTAR